MSYDFEVKVRTYDYWKLSMYNTYHSMVGVVNLVFFASMLLLCYRFFYSVGYGLQTLMFVGLILIPVIHPFGVYFKARTQVMLSPKGTRLHFDDKGMEVRLEDKKQFINYKKIAGIKQCCGLLIIYSDNAHGYILTRQSLGRDRKSFISFIKEKCRA